ncbi:thiolase family protein [Pseudomonas aeruginosa]
MNPLLQREVPGIYYPMGQTAEIVARRYGITREAQDAYALQSQQRMARAQADGLFADEIVPMTTRYAVEDKASGEKQVLDGVVDRDDCNRPDTTLEGLASLKPAFAEDGSVTAGNASQLSDGASMTLLMSLEKALALGLEPEAFFRGFTVAGCEPDEMGIGPVFSVPKLLKAKGLKIADVDLWELNEAFASQCLYCRDRLEIDNESTTSMAAPSPSATQFGMTGSRQVGHLVRELRRRNLRYGVVTMCVGGGMAPAGCSKPYAEPVRRRRAPQVGARLMGFIYMTLRAIPGDSRLG